MICGLQFSGDPSYNNIGLWDTPLQRQIFCGANQFLPVAHNIILFYNDTKHLVPVMTL